MSTRIERSTPATVPSDLETARAKLVYLYVSTQDGATIDEICRTLDLTKGTALTITNAMRDRGHLERSGDRLVTT